MIKENILKNRFAKVIQNSNPVQLIGKVTKVVGLVLESDGPSAPIGEICYLRDSKGRIFNQAEIVGFKDGNKILSMVLGGLENIAPGTEIISTGKPFQVNLSNHLLGRVIDGLGNPIDDLGNLSIQEKRSIYSKPPNPLKRKIISEPLYTGIRAIDGLLSLGRGQRAGIFAGSGVGKSTLLGMIAKNTSADINVIALVGERGREVKEFIENELGKEGLMRSVVVVATSDQPALVRVKAALLATTISEYFRDQGLDVMLMMDSVTRLAMAQREVGLAIGEPPTTRGYTPSVFSLMQQTMERAGTAENGSITGLYTVLVDGDDFNEPISDSARGVLDGHIILSRKMASLGHYPAIDVLESVSRVMNKVIFEDHTVAARQIKQLMANYRRSEDLINIGAYQKGTNPLTDKAIEMHPLINEFLQQNVSEATPWEQTVENLVGLSSN
ncbi:FliI/YscN family ATPase [Candidatus Kapabacteria bacterium]|nr:FliI/YscN family ATPase [Candidatus Kapabacteria bacterium]